MTRQEQCFRACALLSALLTSQTVPHAFSGGFLTVALGSPRETEVRARSPVLSSLSLFDRRSCGLVLCPSATVLPLGFISLILVFHV